MDRMALMLRAGALRALVLVSLLTTLSAKADCGNSGQAYNYTNAARYSAYVAWVYQVSAIRIGGDPTGYKTASANYYAAAFNYYSAALGTANAGVANCQ